jgi:heme/copper-type cytochrome/quinol oxidase subunit 3
VSELALSQADLHEHHGPTPTSTGTTMGKVFMWLFLCQDALMFMGLFASYISVRIGLGGAWPSPNNHGTLEHYPLDINLTAVNTFVLICSSVTMVMAVQAAAFKNNKGAIKWLLLTILGGSIFLGVQVYEYKHLIGHDGMGMGKSLFDATFFALTGFHGLHVFSGVVYLICVAIAVKLGPKVYKDVGVMEWVFRVVSVGLTIYFAVHTLGLWKEGPFILKYLLLLPFAVGGAYFMPIVGPILFFWFIPFANFPPIPHVAVSLVAGSIFFVMYRSIKWLRARNDMPELIEIVGLYWHFVDLIWIILFTLVYLL